MTTFQRPVIAVILAAGKGTRMKSDLPKVIHPILGKPMVTYITDACQKASIVEILMVVGHKADLVKKTLGSDFHYVEQTQQLGTGHALMIASQTMQNFKGDILVLAGDTPFLTGNILKKLIHKHQQMKSAATLMTAVLDPTPPYGRIIRNESGQVRRIIEDRDATPEQKKIREVNTSHYCFQTEKIFPLLKSLKTDNDQGEYYLTDIIRLMTEKKLPVETMTAKDVNILIGINSKRELAECSQKLKQKLLDNWMDKGVTIVDPVSVYIEPDVKLGKDAILHPFTSLTGKTSIGRGCEIGPQTKLHHAKIGENCQIAFSVIENRKIEAGKIIGPFASISGEI